MKGLQYHPEIFCKHNPSHAAAGRIAREIYYGSVGARRLVRNGQSLCQELFHHRMSTHFYSSVGAHQRAGKWMVVIASAVDPRIAEHVKIGTSYVLLTKENLGPMIHA